MFCSLSVNARRKEEIMAGSRCTLPLFVTQSGPVESEEVCVCVWQLNVDGCIYIWIWRGEREVGGRGREHERSRQEKEAWVGWVIRQIQIGGVVRDH